MEAAGSLLAVFAERRTTSLGSIETDRSEKQPAAALEPLERAVTACESKAGDPLDLALARFNLARALWQSQGDRRRAIALARLARQGFARYPRSRDDLLSVQQWLAEHPAP